MSWAFTMCCSAVDSVETMQTRIKKRQKGIRSEAQPPMIEPGQRLGEDIDGRTCDYAIPDGAATRGRTESKTGYDNKGAGPSTELTT